MMNQASQQSNNLNKLINELKMLWNVETSEFDEEAVSLIKTCEISTTLDKVSREEFDIQKKVLAKTREKIETLLVQLKTLEENQTK